MKWEAIVLLATFGYSALTQVYYIERPRKMKTAVEAFFGCLELGFYVILVLRLAGKA